MQKVTTSTKILNLAVIENLYSRLPDQFYWQLRKFITTHGKKCLSFISFTADCKYPRSKCKITLVQMFTIARETVIGGALRIKLARE